MIDSPGKQVAAAISVALNWVLPTQASGSVGLLLYHRITDSIDGIEEPTINVKPATFRRQIEGLVQRGFRFQHLADVLECCEQSRPMPDKSVVVTFDDGYENVYLNAWPVLKEFNIPATIFVNTAELDTDEAFASDQWGQQYQSQLPAEAYRPLQYEQCREMIDSGLITIGAHTHSHADFRRRPKALLQDLQLNLAELEQQLGLDEVPFAFPYGRVSLGFAGGELTEAARRAGVTCALTTECELNGSDDDPFHWGRFNVYDFDTPATLEAKLAGWYGWAPKLQDKASAIVQALTPSHGEPTNDNNASQL